MNRFSFDDFGDYDNLLDFGIYDVSDLTTMEVNPGEIDEDTGTNEKIEAFIEKHGDSYCIAEGYESENIVFLSNKPKRINRIADARDFMYMTVTIDTKGASRLLFVLNH